MYKIQVDSILSFYRHKWVIFNMKLIPLVYLPFYLSGKESACQRRRPRRYRFNIWVGKIPWRRKWPTPVFLPSRDKGT